MNFFPAAPAFAPPPGATEAAIRPEDVMIGPHEAAIGLDGVVQKVTFLGREAQVLIESWRRHYNAVRPHSSLGYRPPAAA